MKYVESKEKLISLFKYIKELYAQKYKVIKDIKHQEWSCFVSDIPIDEDNIVLNYTDRTDSEEDMQNEETYLLRVSKPEFQSCPKPPESINGWIYPSWERFTNLAGKIDVKTVNRNGEDTEEKFEDNPQRLQDWSNWHKQRELWIIKQRKIDKTRNFFNQLYMNYIALERDSETIEIMVGQGIIAESEIKSGLYHPVLLKRLKMEFDSEKNIISILDTTVESEVYTMLLQELDYINHSAIKTLKEQLSQNYYHPLDRNETPDFLRSFIHMLYSDSKFVSDELDEVTMFDKLLMYSKPVFFVRKKISGVVRAIEEIITQIEVDGVSSGPLFNLIGDSKVEIEDIVESIELSEKLAALSGEDKDILLSKEANREQLEIAKRIERYNAVLVQGPPGTGKTHTIANLLGHFLAQGKSVLVTSHTKKALTVVKDKVPKGLQSLCVSVLEDSNRDMERSVDGITEYLSAHSSIELMDRAEKLKVTRSELLNELSEVRQRIFAIKFKEFKPIVLNGKGYSPSEAANYVYENSELLSFIPGKVVLYKPLPVTLGDFDILYDTNNKVNKDEELELEYKLPNPNLILSPHNFKKIVDDFNNNIENLRVLKDKVDKDICINLDNGQITVNQLLLVTKLNIDELKELQIDIETKTKIDDGLIYAILDGKKGGGYKAVWENLITKIKHTSQYADSIVEKTIGKQIIIDNSLDKETINLVLTELKGHYKQGKKVSKINLIFHKLWNEVLSKITINDKKINCEEDCDIILSHISLIEKRNDLSILWNELITKRGGANFNEFGEEPERICLNRAAKIEEYLNWYDKTYIEIANKIEKAGINLKVLFEKKEFNSEIEELRYILSVISNDLPVYIEIVNIVCVEIKRLQALIDQSNEVLTGKTLSDSEICKNISRALLEKETVAYENYYRILDEFYTKYHYLNERIRILDMLKKYAPDWADQIKNRIGIHGESKVPKNIEDAWRCKQFAGIIDEITSEPFEKLQQKSVALNVELRNTTAKLAENLAWYHLLKRIEKDIDKKQALQGWKLTVKKIGKGTGKNAPKLKREAQRLMAKCQTAVPAWIMPVNKALESLDPTKNKFDIVIIDEASQSDISALAIMYLAKKIIIVGDDEQVSPSAIGVDTEKMDALAAMYIKGVIPNAHLYDMKSSLYDIAKTTFPTLMLKEHFRCVPEIIGYSNKLSYDYKIKPLRDDSNSILKPATIAFRVDGERHSYQKTNSVEAENIVALMMSCMEQPEYKDMTFGAISLLGEEQARKINDLALNKIDPKEYEKRAILCGNASHFQGDERDVIFLSLVDNNGGEGPLRMVGEGAGKSTKQRYNVAVSRAKNQLWVVHSLDVSRDLKNDDMRRDLIEYMENPSALRQKIEGVNAHAESPFEKSVGRDLVSKGYHIVPQWVVGSYRIDMVAVCGNDKVAIECDGELYHSGEDKVREDMERQTILERLGWRFIRIRGSEYYRNPKLTMDRVIKELMEYDIQPEDLLQSCVSIDTNELLERVKIRASQIISEWKEPDKEDESQVYS